MDFFLMRHAESESNKVGRMEGKGAASHLTVCGVDQATAMGGYLARAITDARDIEIWSSAANRTLETATIVCECLGRDTTEIKTDGRLLEMDIGIWENRYLADIVAEDGSVLCPHTGVLLVRPPNGEWYSDVADRVADWLSALTPGRKMVFSHGITLRVMRGLLTNSIRIDGVAVAPAVRQGSIIQVKNGVEAIIYQGDGHIINTV